jgi:hypothetical protein
MSAPKARLIGLIGLVSAAFLPGSAFAVPERVIEPERKDQGFPAVMQEQREEGIRIAGPNEQPQPAGSGIDECIAQCANGVGW